MVLPHPEVNDIIPFRKGIQHAPDSKSIGPGARLVNTTKGNGIVLFEALSNDSFSKWEQIHSPIYCEVGTDRKTMDCKIDIHS